MDETLNMTVKYAPIGIWAGIAIGVFATLVVVALMSLYLWCRSLSARVEKQTREAAAAALTRRVYELEKGKKPDG